MLEPNFLYLLGTNTVQILSHYSPTQVMVSVSCILLHLMFTVLKRYQRLEGHSEYGPHVLKYYVLEFRSQPHFTAHEPLYVSDIRFCAEFSA